MEVTIQTNTPGNTLTGTVRRRIHARRPGSVIAPADFLAFGSRAAVDQALSRLSREGMIKRLRRGVYYYPQVSKALGITLSPTPEDIAQALARSHKAQLQVSGAQAANLLGLTEQVPARVVYLTDGASSKVQMDTQTIELRHAAPRSMRAAGRVSGTVIQALRHLGESQVTPDVVEKLRSNLSAEDKRVVKRDLLLAPGWMHPLLSAVAEEALLPAIADEPLHHEMIANSNEAGE